MKKQIRLSSGKLKNIIRESIIEYLNEESGWYPAGAENDPNAPWNQSDPEAGEESVTVQLVLSADINVMTTAYTYEYLGNDEEGCPDYDLVDVDYEKLKEDAMGTIGAGEGDKVDCLGIKWSVDEICIDY